MVVAVMMMMMMMTIISKIKGPSFTRLTSYNTFQLKVDHLGPAKSRAALRHLTPSLNNSRTQLIKMIEVMTRIYMDKN